MRKRDDSIFYFYFKTYPSVSPFVHHKINMSQDLHPYQILLLTKLFWFFKIFTIYGNGGPIKVKFFSGFRLKSLLSFSRQILRNRKQLLQENSKAKKLAHSCTKLHPKTIFILVKLSHNIGNAFLLLAIGFVRQLNMHCKAINKTTTTFI